MLIAAAAILVFLGAMWLPVYLVLRKRNVQSIATRCAVILTVQVVSAGILIWLADAVGLLNPGGYILAIVFATTVAGVVYARFAPVPVSRS